MIKKIVLALLIGATPLQATWRISLKKYATYLGCATLGGIAILLSLHHKKFRPYFKNLYFPSYVESHGNLIHHLNQKNDEITQVQLLQNNLTEEIATLQETFTQFKYLYNDVSAQNTNLHHTISSIYRPLITTLKNQLDTLTNVSAQETGIMEQHHVLALENIYSLLTQLNDRDDKVRAILEETNTFEQEQSTDAAHIEALKMNKTVRELKIRELQFQINQQATTIQKLEGQLKTLKNQLDAQDILLTLNQANTPDNNTFDQQADIIWEARQ
ncbi:MAG: hypothetical protein WD068_03430 [Candidatus Babeliales bacterium]